LNTHPDVDPRDRKKYFMEETPARLFFLGLTRIFFQAIMVIKVEGLENFPLDGSVIIAANHITNFDGFVIQLAAPRVICFMGKVELFNSPLDLFCVFCAYFQLIAAKKMNGRFVMRAKSWILDKPLACSRKGSVQ
jgi:1-acyl-sn-glycerol-3-phosphate acyltransferase